MGILFDLDGTLLDTAPDFIYAVQQIRQEEKLPTLTKAIQDQLRLAVSCGTPAIIETGFNIKTTDTQYEPFYKRLIESYQKNLGHLTKPFPGIENLLHSLEQRQIPWGIVTNKLSWLTEPLLKQQGLYNRASCIISGDSTPNPKPHPAPLLLACEKIQITPAKCLYIGDAERDIVAGNAAGMTTLVALFGYIDDIETAKKWSAHHAVQHADEILPWYEAWSQLP